MMKRRAGFTLVELMIAVAIIGILAAIAVPRAHEWSLKAKVAEAPTNVDGIITAQIAYEASMDAFVDISDWHPTRSMKKEAQEWTAGSEFDTIGWEPDGEVRCKYRATLKTNRLRAQAKCDVDNDNKIARYRYDLMFNDRATPVYGWTTGKGVY